MNIILFYGVFAVLGETLKVSSIALKDKVNTQGSQKRIGQYLLKYLPKCY